MSSYWVACDRIGSARDIYAEEIYSLPQVDPSAPRVGRPLGPLIVDQYKYPPSFLVLPRLIAAATGDFWGFRRVWFALNLAVVAAGVILVAARFDRALATHALWLTPFALLASSIIITLVMGNVQLAIVAMSMIAMLMFDRRRHAAGGILLAYAVVSKLYPGLLLLYLLLRRDWRAVAWTGAFAMAFVVVSIADFGVGPYIAFATHMPKLLSGEAFPAFRNPVAIAVNESIPGLVFKLQLFGVPYMGFAASKAVGWIYTIVAIALTTRLALRPVAAGREPLAWITILILATMRSPFLPTYAPFPSMWLATLLAALTWGRSRVFTTIGRRLERTRVHVRHGRSAAPRERDLDLRAHRRCLRARRHRVSDGGDAAGSFCESIRRCHRPAELSGGFIGDLTRPSQHTVACRVSAWVAYCASLNGNQRRASSHGRPRC